MIKQTNILQLYAVLLQACCNGKQQQISMGLIDNYFLLTLFPQGRLDFSQDREVFILLSSSIHNMLE